MPAPLQIDLSPGQEAELTALRDHAPKPYVRERAAAILKVAAGTSQREVARTGLLRPRSRGAVGRWVARYLAEGGDGLMIRAGRGRKPAFSPTDRRRGRRHADCGPA